MILRLVTYPNLKHPLKKPLAIYTFNRGKIAMLFSFCHFEVISTANQKFWIEYFKLQGVKKAL